MRAHLVVSPPSQDLLHSLQPLHSPHTQSTAPPASPLLTVALGRRAAARAVVLVTVVAVVVVVAIVVDPVLLWHRTARLGSSSSQTPALLA